MWHATMDSQMGGGGGGGTYGRGMSIWHNGHTSYMISILHLYNCKKKRVSLIQLMLLELHSVAVINIIITHE